LEQDVETFRRAVQSRAPVAKIGYMLYRNLIEPIEPLLADKHTVFIVPDGVLRLLPFEALPINLSEMQTQYLISRPYQIVYAHSAQVLAITLQSEAGSARNSQQKSMVLFGAPDYSIPASIGPTHTRWCGNRTFRGLPFAMTESEQLRTLFGL